MQILAVYGSEYGQAEAVLRRIADALRARGHIVAIHKGNQLPETATPDRYDAVLVAASIVMGHYQAYIRDFVTTHRAALGDRPTAFISVNGSSPESVPEWRAAAARYVRQFLAQTGWTPRWTATFSGALRYPRYGLITRLVMRMISRSQGGPTDTSHEFEFTDWQAVDRFAETLCTALATEGRARWDLDTRSSRLAV